MIMSCLSPEYNPPTYDLRRSERLHRSGYYGSDGSPTISYKETLFRVFKRRRGHRAARVSFSDSFEEREEEEEEEEEKKKEEEEEEVEEQKTSTRRRYPGYCWCMGLFKLFMSVVLIGLGLGLFFGFLGFTSYTSNITSNYALLSDGAQVLASHSSQTYWPNSWWLRYQAWRCPKQPFILCPHSPLPPGVCWPFAGDSGHVHIQLSKNIHISHITLGHITKEQSPTEETSSAPKDFVVYGMKSKTGEKTFLGQFQYDSDGPSFQTFAVQNILKDTTFGHVQIQVLNNWGNKDFTCLYNIRVHGTPQTET